MVGYCQQRQQQVSFPQQLISVQAGGELCRLMGVGGSENGFCITKMVFFRKHGGISCQKQGFATKMGFKCQEEGLVKPILVGELVKPI